MDMQIAVFIDHFVSVSSHKTNREYSLAILFMPLSVVDEMVILIMEMGRFYES